MQWGTGWWKAVGEKDSNSLPNHRTDGHLELRKCAALPWELGLLPKELFLKEPEGTSGLLCSMGKGDHWAIGLSAPHKVTLGDLATLSKHSDQTQFACAVLKSGYTEFKHPPRMKHAWNCVRETVKACKYDRWFSQLHWVPHIMRNHILLQFLVLWKHTATSCTLEKEHLSKNELDKTAHSELS